MYEAESYTNVETFGKVGKILLLFLKEVICSPRQQLFDQKDSKRVL